ncbi:DUF1127 domain-containing protein [Dankookia sp. GCM10030260]|uniref:DUF1127 domain-containing protein n=1 Tax=Dankookia sp. GCM10030260 TaxID=3273390 RepID=UPI0036168F74
MHIARLTPPALPALASVPLAEAAAPRGIWPAWLETILARRTERQQLLALEARDLRDIGLTPSEALALAQQPLWPR